MKFCVGNAVLEIETAPNDPNDPKQKLYGISDSVKPNMVRIG